MRRISLLLQSFRKIVLRGWAGARVVAWVVVIMPLLHAQIPQSGLSPSGSRKASVNAPGPAVGEKIPFFRAPDQYGRMQDLNSLRGPNGAMILFERSLDW